MKKIIFSIILLLFTLFSLSYADDSPSTGEQIGVAITSTGISTAMDLAENSTSKEFFDSISTFKSTVGNTLGTIDVITDLATGKNKQAAISASITALSNLAETNQGKAVLSYFGISSTGFGLILTAYQIEQQSEKELESNTNATLIESLYGSIEADPFLHKRNRKFGDKTDPIPVTEEAVNYVWKKIVNGSWRNVFKPYVTDVLGKDWPEVSLWDKFFLPSNLQSSILDEKILEKEDEYKTYIASILSSLNTLAKYRESLHEMRVVLKELQSKFSNENANSILQKYFNAKEKLPEVKTFLAKCSDNVSDSIKNHDKSLIYSILYITKNYLLDIMPYLPKDGKSGTENLTIYSDLKGCRDNAENALNTILKYYEDEEQNIADTTPPSVWTIDRIGFNIDINSTENDLSKKFWDNTSNYDVIFSDTKNSVEQKYSDEVASKYGDIYNNAYNDYKSQKTSLENNLNNPDNTDEQKQEISAQLEKLESDFNNFETKLSSFEEMDNEVLKSALKDIDMYEKKLIFLYSIEKFKYNNFNNRVLEIFNQLYFKYCCKEEFSNGYPFSLTSFRDINYVGLINFKLPPMSSATDIKSSDFLYNSYYYINNLMPDIEKVKDDINFNLNLLDELNGIDLDEDNAKITELENRIDELESFINNMQSTDDKDNALKTLTDYKEKLNKIKSGVEKIITLKNATSNFYKNFTTDYYNVENDIDYLKRLNKIIDSAENAQYYAFGVYFDNNSFTLNDPLQNKTFFIKHEVYEKLLSKEDNVTDCDILIEAETPFMDSKDISKYLDNLTFQLENAGALWLDENYNIGIKNGLNYLINDLKNHEAPANYVIYKNPDTKKCEVVTKEDMDNLTEKLVKYFIVTTYWFDMKVQNFYDYIYNNSNYNNYNSLNTVYHELINWLLQLDQGKLSNDSLPENYLPVLAGLSNNTKDDVIKSSVNSIMKIVNTINNEYWNSNSGGEEKTPEENCAYAGMYWYDDNCYSTPKPEEKCDYLHYNLCTTSADCLNAGGIWDQTYCSAPPPDYSQQCDSNHLFYCKTESDCINNAGEWINGICYEKSNDNSPITKISIVSGWNLKALPVNVAENVNINDLFNKNSIKTVWKWSGSSWEIYSPIAAISQLIASYKITAATVIKSGEGFWVNSDDALTVNVNGSEGYGLEALKINTGWNLLGAGSNINITDLSNIENIKTVWRWNGSNWQIWSPVEAIDNLINSYKIDTITTIEQGEGFWVNK